MWPQEISRMRGDVRTLDERRGFNDGRIGIEPQVPGAIVMTDCDR
jgi:hypothetical protein